MVAKKKPTTHRSRKKKQETETTEIQHIVPQEEIIVQPVEEAVEANSHEKYMTLGDHLEELRQRILKGLLLIAGITIIGLFFGEQVHLIFTSPYKRVLGENATFYQIKLMAPFLIYLKTSFILAILIGFPFLLYLVWGFVAPALDDRSDRFGKWIVLSSTLLFWGGVALCWAGVFENVLRFFLTMFRPPDIDARLPIDEYYEIFFNIHLVFGITFQLPVVMILLGSFGILTTSFLLDKWREIVLGLSVIAAVMSPGPDIMSMMMLFIPLVILFFTSILVMKISENKKENGK